VRHYNLVYVLPFQDESMQRIFGTVMTWFLAKFPGQVSSLAKDVVKATVEIYTAISAGMLPTPAKSHYTFNLRDLSKVHQGICLCSNNSLAAADDLVKCWAHECQRVFQDRLVSHADQNWFFGKLKDCMDSHFKKSWKSLVKTEPLIFVDFVDPKQAYYQEVADHARLSDTLQHFLTDYNQMAKRGMELVLFLRWVTRCWWASVAAGARASPSSPPSWRSTRCSRSRSPRTTASPTGTRM